jgi:UDP-glucose 4-epimerase
MKILVTGGAGFIGSNVSDALLADGHDVHILDDLSSGKKANLPDGATFHEAGIGSDEATRLFEEEQFEALYHLAAQMDVRKSVEDPVFDANINVLGFLNLMEAGRENGLKKVVFSSTGGAIYGEPEYTPQDEDHALKPISPYGITKLVAEKYLHFYHLQHGLQYVALRYANVYGPRQDAHGDAGVVAIFSRALLGGEQPEIYGDGEQTRDYVFVKDVVRANVAALALDEPQIVNIGTAEETTVNELFRQIRDLAGSDAEEEHADARPGEQQRSVIDPSKASRVLDWSPAHPLKDGLATTVQWFEDHPDR